MVRPDHEDGGVLNSPEDSKPDDGRPESDRPEAGRPEAVVRRSSPLSGRRKKAPQPAAEPETAEVPDEDAEPAEAEQPEAESAPTEVEPTEVEPTEVEPDADEVARNAAYRERRRNKSVVRKSARDDVRSGSRLTIIAVALTALVVVVGVVLSAVFGYQYYKIEQQREWRAEYSTFAQQMVVSMSTLDPDNADQMYKNAMEKTSGRAKQMFQENMKQVADMVRKGDMVTKTTIVADAVSKADEDEGSVLVVYAWEGHPKNDKKNVESTTFRARVDMTRINGELKMTYFDWVA
ncbi:hypothetical protein [Gordonia neofelifaecis]|uniref:Mce-associated membrane protein n=1 Tax=Gordonia neofelifaecis NRRL B-59395 TaxID=644548 RepID=F1YIW5_9ACTN|nr:hypothetical protein [Gordonia neofelifaecis]EGD55412.1 hypothetical protein SCNU_09141 [Gordonia neofelifaecis NRRL B-59395]